MAPNRDRDNQVTTDAVVQPDRDPVLDAATVAAFASSNIDPAEFWAAVGAGEPKRVAAQAGALAAGIASAAAEPADVAPPPLVSILADATEDLLRSQVARLDEDLAAERRLRAASEEKLARYAELLVSRTETICEIGDRLQSVCVTLGAPASPEQPALVMADVIAQLVSNLQVRIGAVERLQNEAEAQVGTLRSDLETAQHLLDLSTKHEAELDADLQEVTAKHDALLLASLHSPWEDLAKARGQELDEIEDRLQVLANEAFGPFQVQTPAQNMDAIESGIGGLVTRLRESTRPRKAAPPRAPKPDRRKPTPKAKAKTARRR